MTAEIVVMNKEAVALAADSAATIRIGNSEKIFSSSPKLFALSKKHPVGIMVYGNAQFMGVPWETIIKMYRANLGNKCFDTLEKYGDDFIEFLKENIPSMFPIRIQEKYVKSAIDGYLLYIKRDIEYALDDIYNYSENELVDGNDIISITSETIHKHYELWENAEVIPSIDSDLKDRLVNKYDDYINKSISEVFERLDISEEDKSKLKNIAVNLFLKFPDEINSNSLSGIVIAGFGDNEIFPSLLSYNFERIVENNIKYTIKNKSKIDHSNGASIVPFAQDDMVHTFMRGINPNYAKNLMDYISNLLENYTSAVLESEYIKDDKKDDFKESVQLTNNEIIENFVDYLEQYELDHCISPTIDIVSILPKDELAELAESLIHLTSLKRRYSTDSETVGGPIDVAVISKGDGFVWIKRKHYFNPELNYDFFNRRR